MVQSYKKNRIFSWPRLISCIKENFVFLFFKLGVLLLKGENYGYPSGILQKDF